MKPLNILAIHLRKQNIYAFFLSKRIRSRFKTKSYAAILFICCSLKCSIQVSQASSFFPISSSTPEVLALLQPVAERGHKRCDWKQKPLSIHKLASVWRERKQQKYPRKQELSQLVH